MEDIEAVNYLSSKLPGMFTKANGLYYKDIVYENGAIY